MAARRRGLTISHKFWGPTESRVSESDLGALNFGEERNLGVGQETTYTIMASLAEAGGTLTDTAAN